MYIVCVAYFLAGFNVYNTKISVALYEQLDPSLKAHLHLFTVHQIGLIFMLATISAALLTAFKKVDLAYALMTFLLTWWTLMYVVSWIQTGYWQSIYGIANYALTAAILVLVSRVVEMPKEMLTKEPTLFSSSVKFDLEEEDGHDER
jgi:hypothetical protein